MQPIFLKMFYANISTLWELDFDDKNNIRVVKIETSLVGMAGEFHMWSTNMGDGTYPLLHRGAKIGELGVDAGCLSVIPMSVIKGWGAEADARSLGCIVDDHRKAGIFVENGDMFWGDYNILTSWDTMRDMEQEDEWMECDQESYI